MIRRDASPTDMPLAEARERNARRSMNDAKMFPAPFGCSALISQLPPSAARDISPFRNLRNVAGSAVAQ